MIGKPHEEPLLPRRVDDDHAFGTWNQVVIAVWRVETRAVAALDLGDLIAECARKYSDGIALLQVIEETARAPAAGARSALARMHGEHAKVIRRSALVFTKPGFAGAAVRAVMTGVAMLNPPAFEHQLFAEVPAARSWLEKNLWPEGTSLISARFRKVVEELRAMRRLSPAPATRPVGAGR